MLSFIVFVLFSSFSLQLRAVAAACSLTRCAQSRQPTSCCPATRPKKRCRSDARPPLTCRLAPTARHSSTSQIHTHTHPSKSNCSHARAKDADRGRAARAARQKSRLSALPCVARRSRRAARAGRRQLAEPLPESGQRARSEPRTAAHSRALCRWLICAVQNKLATLTLLGALTKLKRVVADQCVPARWHSRPLQALTSIVVAMS